MHLVQTTAVTSNASMNKQALVYLGPMAKGRRDSGSSWFQSLNLRDLSQQDKSMSDTCLTDQKTEIGRHLKIITFPITL